MKTKIIIALKGYFYGIFKYILTEAYAEKFNIKRLQEKAINNRQYLANKLGEYTIEKSKIALQNFEEIQKQAESIEGYAGTIEDEEMIEVGGGAGGSGIGYKGQTLRQAVYSEKSYDQLENKDKFGFTQCFLYANMSNVLLGSGIEFNPQQRLEASNKSQKSKDYDINIGGYFGEGRRITQELLDEMDIEYNGYVFSAHGKYLRIVLDAGYPVTLGMRISDELKNGMRKDGILTADEMVGVTKYNHLVNIRKNKQGTLDLWIDNYPESRSQNVFTIDDLEFLAKSGKFMNVGSFYEITGGKGYLEQTIQGYEYIDQIDESKYDLKLVIKWLIAFEKKDAIIYKDVSQLSESDRIHSALASKIRNNL